MTWRINRVFSQIYFGAHFPLFLWRLNDFSVWLLCVGGNRWTNNIKCESSIYGLFTLFSPPLPSSLTLSYSCSYFTISKSRRREREKIPVINFVYPCFLLIDRRRWPHSFSFSFFPPSFPVEKHILSWCADPSERKRERERHLQIPLAACSSFILSPWLLITLSIVKPHSKQNCNVTNYYYLLLCFFFYLSSNFLACLLLPPLTRA